MRIGVMNVSGSLGRTAVGHLKGRVGWEKAFAVTRSPEEVARLEPRTVSLSAAAPGSLPALLAQVDRLLVVGSRDPAPDEEAWHAAAVAAAGSAGVERIVYMSLLRADGSPLPGAAAHLRLEAQVAACSVPSTILRVGCFAEDYLIGLERVVRSSRLPGAAGAAPFSPASVTDYAFAAASALLGDGHEGLTYELAGDRRWTLAEVAAEIAWQTRRDVACEELSPEGLAAEMRAMGLSAGEAADRVALDAAAAAGALLEERRQMGGLRYFPTQSLPTSVWLALMGTGLERLPFRGIRPGTGGRLKPVPRALAGIRRHA